MVALWMSEGAWPRQPVGQWHADPLEVAEVLVERDAELAALTDLLHTAALGGGGVAVLAGPAGIGKTSLLGEVARRAREAGALVLTARGTKLEQEFAFGVVRQLFEPALARAGRQRRALLSGAAEPAGAVLGPVTEPIAVGDFAVLHGLYRLTTGVCAEQPVVMVVDDLHWADPGSLRLLAYLQPRLAGLRLAVVAGCRPDEPGAEQHLLDLLMVDRSCAVLRPTPLTRAGSALVLDELLGAPPPEGFLDACQQATGGNPLLLRELARTLDEERLSATDGNAARVPELGGRSLAMRVATRMARLPDGCQRLVRAVAVLGEDVPQYQAAALGGLDMAVAAEAAERLRRMDVLRVAAGPAGSGPLLGFVHPLVRAAVYGDIHPVELGRAHAAAATLLREAGAETERVATHVLRTPPTGAAGAFDVLHRAAVTAAGRGAPEAALGYLRRCLAEPLRPDVRRQVINEIGPIAALVDLTGAAGYLAAAMESAADVASRADLAHRLSRVLFLLDRAEEAARICGDALGWLPEHEVDLRRRMLAALLNHAIWEPAYPGRAQVVAHARALPPDASLGGAMLDAVLAVNDGLAGDPAAVGYAERAVGNAALLDLANVDAGWLIGACETLLAADRDEAMTALDAGLARAGRAGSITAAAMMLVLRGLGRLWRGELQGAVEDLRDAGRDAELVGLRTAPFIGGFLPDALLELGRVDEAAQALAAAEAAGPPLTGRSPAGPWYFVLEARARLARVQGRYQAGLAAARAAGRSFEAFQFGNPAFCGWSSEAALCLHALGRSGEAVELAEEELALARRWGAPRALGRALRVVGLVRGQAAGRELLAEAVRVLRDTPARLEHAKALVELGALLRRDGELGRAKEHLHLGMDLAHRCGADPVTRRAETELRATGARPRQPSRTGLDALTPSEQRVVELAVTGLTNREIAQRLFVTPKTVEVHLSSSYRKLGVKRRSQLRTAG
jgi:DNA-binding CsgD family transcriptional regulator/tetratricopeptide (TPR) repeat protein